MFQAYSCFEHFNTAHPRLCNRLHVSFISYICTSLYTKIQTKDQQGMTVCETESIDATIELTRHQQGLRDILTAQLTETNHSELIMSL